MEDNTIFKIQKNGDSSFSAVMKDGCDAADLIPVLVNLCFGDNVGGRDFLNILLSAAGMALAGVKKEVADRVWEETRSTSDGMRDRILGSHIETDKEAES